MIYTEKGATVRAYQYLGWNWQEFIYLTNASNWSMCAGKIDLTVKHGDHIELAQSDWMVISKDNTVEIYSENDFNRLYQL